MEKLSDMKKFIKIRGGRKPSNYLSISKCGWATITDGLYKHLNAGRYKTVDFFSNEKEKTIALVFYTDHNGELKLRERRTLPTPSSCGFSIIRFISYHPEFVGYYKLSDVEENKNLTVFFTRTEVN